MLRLQCSSRVGSVARGGEFSWCTHGNRLSLRGETTLGGFEHQTQSRRDKARHAGDQERHLPNRNVASGILEVRRDPRTHDARDAVGKKDPGIVGPDVLVAEEVRRRRRGTSSFVGLGPGTAGSAAPSRLSEKKIRC